MEPRGLGQWLQAADEPGVAVRVRLRDGAAEHVVVWQWQSKSRRLACIAPASLVVSAASFLADPAAEPVGVLEAVPTARHLPTQYAIAATVVRTGALEAGAGAVPAAPEVWSSVEINQ